MKKQRNPNRTLTTLEVCQRIQQERADLVQRARIVGQWVWVEFPSKPDDATREWLSNLGFHYNGQRRAWQHPCGKFCTASRADPRFAYGEIPIDEAEEIFAGATV